MFFSNLFVWKWRLEFKLAYYHATVQHVRHWDSFFLMFIIDENVPGARVQIMSEAASTSLHTNALTKDRKFSHLRHCYVRRMHQYRPMWSNTDLQETNTIEENDCTLGESRD